MIKLNKRTKNKKYFHGVDLKLPTKEEFEKYINLWNNKYDNEFHGR